MVQKFLATPLEQIIKLLTIIDRVIHMEFQYEDKVVCKKLLLFHNSFHYQLEEYFFEFLQICIVVVILSFVLHSRNLSDRSCVFCVCLLGSTRFTKVYQGLSLKLISISDDSLKNIRVNVSHRRRINEQSNILEDVSILNNIIDYQQQQLRTETKRNKMNHYDVYDVHFPASTVSIFYP